MYITKANVERYAISKGLEPLQINGIPEGFSWREPDITINKEFHKGRTVKFQPLQDWETGVIYE